MSSADAASAHAVPAATPTAAETAAGPATAAAATAAIAATPTSYEVFEFFAGLGGFCLSLPASLPVHAITAVEIDQRAALTYKYNLHPHEGDNQKQRDEKAAASADGSTSASASAKGAGAGAGHGAQSVRSRIKENRKIFFQQQKEKLAQQQQQAAQAQSSSGDGQVTAVATADAVAAPASSVSAVPAPVAAEPAAAASAGSPSSSSSSGGAPTRLLVASTPLSSFDLPAPDLSARAATVVQPATPARLLLRLIEQLPASALVSSAPDVRPSIWCMSPPCQPFTRTKCAKQLDSADPRSAAFLFLMRTLRSLDHAHRPQHIFLENVKHFFGSDAHAHWLDTLTACSYAFTQYLLSPMQVGVPNHRTRYYCAARRVDPPDAPPTHAQIADMRRALVLVPPGCDVTQSAERVQDDQGAGDQEEEEEDGASTAAAAAAGTAAVAADGGAASCAPVSVSLPKSASLPCCVPPAPLHAFLDPASMLPAHRLDALEVPLAVLARGFHLSVVSPWDRATFCFTGGYGKVINVSSGSFLLHRGPPVDAGHALAAHPLDKSCGLVPYAGQIRFFTPMELLRIFGFPHWYRFPPHFTLVHAYKLIGNSVNISVVRLILQHHLAPCLPPTHAPAQLG